MTLLSRWIDRKRRKAVAELARITRERRESFEITMYRKNRNAQIQRRKLRTGTHASHQSSAQSEVSV